MIRLGLRTYEKSAAIAAYVARQSIRHVVLISPERFGFQLAVPSWEHVEWANVIRYVFYYRLLREIMHDTLVVINEPLRTQDRNDLTYNCIRNFLQQTRHQIVFSYLPIIDTVADVGILIDFDTRSRWKREAPRRDMLAGLDLDVCDVSPTFAAVDVPTDAKTRATYAKQKRELIEGIRLRDPHTIPRTLHLLGGRAKAAALPQGTPCVGRNNRLGLPDLVTYREARDTTSRTVFEFCHNAVDMADFLAVSRQRIVHAMVTALPVDRWYFGRFSAWAGRVRDAYALLGAT